MPGEDNKTIIGKISYTNAWPVFHYVDPAALGTPADMVAAVPAELNRRMHEGSIFHQIQIQSQTPGLASFL